MSPAVIVTLIVVIGIGLVIMAALADRRSARRLESGSDAGPEDGPSRPIRLGRDRDRADPEEPPGYVTADELLDAAPAAARFGPDQERRLAAQLTESSTIRTDCVLAAPTLATHTGTRSILEQPRVLVCADGIGSLREVLALLSTASADMQPLVIAAPTIDAEVLETIIANKLAGKLEVAVVLGELAALKSLAEASGSEPVTLADRQAGAVVFNQLGRPARIVADPSSCWVIREPQSSTPIRKEPA